MWFQGLERLGTLATEPAALGTALLGALLALAQQRRRWTGEHARSGRRQRELMAYMLLDDWKAGDARSMGRRICRTVSRHSAFATAALLVRDGEGRLRVTASMRADDLTTRALGRWAEAESAAEPGELWGKASELEGKSRAQLLQLERRAGYQAGDPAALAWCTALVVPMCTRRGQVTGAIAVCADRFQGRPRRELEAALHPLEVLAARFAEGIGRLGQEGQIDVSEPGLSSLMTDLRTLPGVAHARRSAS